MISRIIKDRGLQNQGFDNSRYHAKTKFNNCFIMYSKPKNKEPKQLNDSNQSFKLMKINIFSTTCRSVL